MDSLIQPNANPTTERQESSLRPILVGIVIVGIVVGVLALILPLRAKKARPASCVCREPEILGPEDKCRAEFCGRHRQLYRWRHHQHRR